MSKRTSPIPEEEAPVAKQAKQDITMVDADTGEEHGVADLKTGSSVVEELSPEPSGNTSLIKLFCEKLNTLNILKPFVKLDELEHDVWLPVNFIRHNIYRTTEDYFHSIYIDMDRCVFTPPIRQKNYILHQIFGIDENGKKMTNQKGNVFRQHIKDDCLTLPGLKMMIYKKEVNGKLYYNFDFGF